MFTELDKPPAMPRNIRGWQASCQPFHRQARGRTPSEEKPMRTRQQIYLDILAQGLLTIRRLASQGDTEQCHAEADHLHNLPGLLAHLENEGLHDHYRGATRKSYLSVNKPGYAEAYTALWQELEEATRREKPAPPGFMEKIWRLFLKWKKSKFNRLTFPSEKEKEAQRDREFWAVLGAEVGPEYCAEPDCKRRCIQYSVLCRRHHFERLRHKPAPDA